MKKTNEKRDGEVIIDAKERMADEENDNNNAINKNNNKNTDNNSNSNTKKRSVYHEFQQVGLTYKQRKEIAPTIIEIDDEDEEVTPNSTQDLTINEPHTESLIANDEENETTSDPPGFGIKIISITFKWRKIWPNLTYLYFKFVAG